MYTKGLFLHVRFSTISRLQRHVREFGRTSSRPHSYISHVTTPAQGPPHLAAATIGVHHQSISAQTVRKRLRDARLHARHPQRGLHLTAARHSNRLEWTNAHIRHLFGEVFSS